MAVLPEFFDVDDLLVLLEHVYLDILNLMFYDDVAVVQFESLDVFD